MPTDASSAARTPSPRDAGPDDVGLRVDAVIEIAFDRFEQLVADALDGIPEELGRYLHNVAVVVDDGPPGPYYGLYEGVPLTRRANYGGMVMPDRITIYRRTILAHARSESDALDRVRRTVIHEVAHHFGISDPRLTELGW